MLQIPVASQANVSRTVVTRRYIRAAQGTQRFQQGLPVGAAGKIAAVEKQVSIGGKRIGPIGDIAGMGADIFESYVGSVIATIAIGATLSITPEFLERFPVLKDLDPTAIKL